MRDFGHRPDVFSHNHLLNACSRRRQWQLAVDILDDMETWPRIGSLYYSVLVAFGLAAVLSGKRQNAEVSAKCFDLISFGTSIAACAKSGQWQAAMSLLQWMSDRQCLGSASIISILLLKAGLVETSRSVYGIARPHVP